MICLISIKGIKDIKWIIHTALPKRNIPGNIDPKVFRTKNNRFVVKSTCSSCGNKKAKFVKKQEASGLLSMLGVKTPFSKIPLLGDLLF